MWTITFEILIGFCFWVYKLVGIFGCIFRLIKHIWNKKFIKFWFLCEIVDWFIQLDQPADWLSWRIGFEPLLFWSATRWNCVILPNLFSNGVILPKLLTYYATFKKEKSPKVIRISLPGISLFDLFLCISWKWTLGSN